MFWIAIYSLPVVWVPFGRGPAIPRIIPSCLTFQGLITILIKSISLAPVTDVMVLPVLGKIAVGGVVFGRFPGGDGSYRRGIFTE